MQQISKIHILYNSALHLRNFHTFPEAVDIQYQSQELTQGTDCIFLGVAAQMRLQKLYKRWCMLQLSANSDFAAVI